MWPFPLRPSVLRTAPFWIPMTGWPTWWTTENSWPLAFRAKRSRPLSDRGLDWTCEATAHRPVPILDRHLRISSTITTAIMGRRQTTRPERTLRSRAKKLLVSWSITCTFRSDAVPSRPSTASVPALTVPAITLNCHLPPAEITRYVSWTHTHSLSSTCQDVQICEAFLKGFERKRRTFCIFRIDLAVCEAKFQQHAHHVNSFYLKSGSMFTRNRFYDFDHDSKSRLFLFLFFECGSTLCRDGQQLQLWTRQRRTRIARNVTRLYDVIRPARGSPGRVPASRCRYSAEAAARRPTALDTDGPKRPTTPCSLPPPLQWSHRWRRQQLRRTTRRRCTGGRAVWDGSRSVPPANLRVHSTTAICCRRRHWRSWWFCQTKADRWVSTWCRITRLWATNWACWFREWNQVVASTETDGSPFKTASSRLIRIRSRTCLSKELRSSSAMPFRWKNSSSLYPISLLRIPFMPGRTIKKLWPSNQGRSFRLHSSFFSSPTESRPSFTDSQSRRNRIRSDRRYPATAAAVLEPNVSCRHCFADPQDSCRSRDRPGRQRPHDGQHEENWQKIGSRIDERARRSGI